MTLSVSIKKQACERFLHFYPNKMIAKYALLRSAYGLNYTSEVFRKEPANMVLDKGYLELVLGMTMR